jgi:hypothetical protein
VRYNWKTVGISIAIFVTDLEETLIMDGNIRHTTVAIIHEKLGGTGHGCWLYSIGENLFCFGEWGTGR